MAKRGTPELKEPWRGPIAYVVLSLLSSLINLGTLKRLESRATDDVLSDVKSTLAVFTAISLTSFALQFIYARAIGQTRTGHRTLGLAPAALIAATVSIATFVTVQSSSEFRLNISAWMGVATLTALLPSGMLAVLLSNQKWVPICAFPIFVSISRLLLWEMPNAESSVSGVLATLTLSHVAASVVLLLITRNYEFKKNSSIKITNEFVPLGILSSIAVLIAAGSIGRRSTLEGTASVFSETSLIGRNLLFVAAIFAYASFPFFTSLKLFSRELGHRFRQAESIVVITVLLLGTLLFGNRFVTQELLDLGQNSDRFLLGVALLSWALIAISLIPLLYYVAHNSRLGLGSVGPAIGMLVAQLVCTTPRALGMAFLACSFGLSLIAVVPSLLRNRPTIRAELAVEVNEERKFHEPITIVVPSHNSGAIGPATVRKIHELFHSHDIDVRVIAVSDGSTDESVNLFDSIYEIWFTHICLPENRGKGGALRAGFERSGSQITGFIDADGDIPTDLLLPMYRELQLRDADVVFGSKWHPSSKVVVTKSRRLLSRLHHVIQRVLFKIDIDDTQVGIKLYRTSSLHEVLPTLRENGFSIDVEIFVALAAYGYDNFVEMPVEINRTGSSTVSVKNVFVSFVDLIRIFWRARVSLNYAALAYEAKINLEESKS